MPNVNRSAFTIFRDNAVPVKFTVQRDPSKALSSIRISKTNEAATEDTALLGWLGIDNLILLKEWFDDDSVVPISIADKQKQGQRIEFARANRSDMDLKLVRISPKGKRKCVLLLNPHQSDRLSDWISRV